MHVYDVIRKYTLQITFQAKGGPELVKKANISLAANFVQGQKLITKRQRKLFTLRVLTATLASKTTITATATATTAAAVKHNCCCQ